MKTLKTELYQTVHNSRLSVEELAELLNVSTSYLYRSVLEGESGCRFPVELLLPLMRATKDYRVLEYLNSRCDRVTAKLPRVARLKKLEPREASKIQERFCRMWADVIAFVENPSAGSLPALMTAMHKHLCDMASVRLSVQDIKQRELDL